MTQQLYKAVTRYRLDDRTVQLIIQLATRSYFEVDDLIKRIIGEFRTSILTMVHEYLEEQGRDGHLLNLYVTLDRDTWTVQIALTFSNRDTALMLKLALA
jgi:hypothetical protein